MEVGHVPLDFSLVFVFLPLIGQKPFNQAIPKTLKGMNDIEKKWPKATYPFELIRHLDDTWRHILSFPPWTPPILQAIMERCWCFERERRPYMKFIIKWLTGECKIDVDPWKERVWRRRIVPRASQVFYYCTSLSEKPASRDNWSTTDSE